MIVNKSTLAKIFGVSANTAGKWMGEGCPHSKAGHGVEFETVEVLEWMYGERPTLNVVKNRQVSGPEVEKEYYDPEQEKARADKERADKLALENELRRGELVRADDVEQEWVKVLMAIRSAVLALPSNVAEELAMLESARQVKKRLTDEAHAILEELSEDDGGGDC